MARYINEAQAMNLAMQQNAEILYGAPGDVDKVLITVAELSSIINLAVSTAIQHPIGYANSNDLIDDGTSFYLLELWKIKDADEGNNIPLYTVKEIS